MILAKPKSWDEIYNAQVILEFMEVKTITNVRYPRVLSLVTIKLRSLDYLKDVLKAFNKIPFKDLPHMIDHEDEIVRVLVRERLSGYIFDPDQIIHQPDNSLDILGMREPCQGPVY